jgi:hypothetical protein
MNLQKSIGYIFCKIKKIIPQYIKIYLRYLAKKAKLTKESRVSHNLISTHGEMVKDFKKALYYCSYSYDSKTIEAFISEYLKKSVQPVRILQSALNENDPTVICIVKDELAKIKLQVEYHRKIGIKHFAYVDNMSKDGTFEWLKEQYDVSLFSLNDTYNDWAKIAYRRQVTDFLGYGGWYLTLDADELFTYPGIETNNINRYVDFLEKNNIRSAFSPMVDMYSSGKLFREDSDVDIVDTYCYFDTDTYKRVKSVASHRISGGPRMRLFALKGDWLFKYALIKSSKQMLIGTHEHYPYRWYNFETKGAIAFLLHYKFLPSDNTKFRENVTSGKYTNAWMYKKYIDAIEQNPNLSFYYEGSQKLNDSMDLMKINLIDKKFFKKFLAE